RAAPPCPAPPRANSRTGLQPRPPLWRAPPPAVPVPRQPPAPPGGGVVSFSPPATTLSVPTNVTVPAGSTTANFTTTAGCVSADQPVTMTAAFNGSSMSASVTVQAGLVAAYAFDEGSGKTTADASLNANTGQVQGATWANKGKHGSALSFNGSSSYVDVGNGSSWQTTGSMTWSAWVYAVANPPDDGQIIARADDASGWQLKISPDTGK